LRKYDKVNRKLAFVLAASDHGPMIVSRLDYRRTPGGVYGVGNEVLENGAYAQQEVSAALSLLDLRRRHHGDGVVAVDCGANVGVHTVEWAKFMTGWGRVLAFEPQDRIFYALAGNVALNNLFNATPHHAAVGARSGQIPVPILDYLVPASYGSLEIACVKGRTPEDIGQVVDREGFLAPVEVVAIDDLSLPRLDLLKVDVEGMEMDVLAGAAETIEACRPAMIVERIKSDEAALRARLAGHGYQVIEFGMNFLAVHESDPILPGVAIERKEAA
jgi:FkbM family methyltransferase